MKLKPLLALLLCTFILLAGCSKKYDPILVNNTSLDPNVKEAIDQDIFKSYKKTLSSKEKVLEMYYLEMDRNYKGKELFTLSHTNKKVYFKVFSYNKRTNKFTKIFEKTTPYVKSAPDYYVQGIAPYFTNKTNHIIVGHYASQTTNAFYYAFIGQTPNTKKIEVLVDSAFSKEAIGIRNADIIIGEQNITVMEEQSIHKNYYQTEENYRAE
ncbi:hypothetical protein [Priestia aryabhattai]